MDSPVEDPAALRAVIRNQRILIVVLSCVTLLTMCGAWGYVIYVPENRERNERNAEEVAIRDTDGDGYRDVEELAVGTDPNSPDRYPGSHKKVLIARREIPKNTVFTEEMFLRKEVAARGEVPADAIMESDMQSVVGHTSTRRILARDVITDSVVSAARFGSGGDTIP